MTSPAADPRRRLAALEQIGIKLGLEQIRALVHALDRPDRAFPSIIVAGTNGKGSVTAMVERGLRAAGYRTGRYTSPHLVHLEERFAIDGESIGARPLEAAIETVLDAARVLADPPSFFEATTAIALELFRRAHVDVAVLEVGLGGRLDATNVVTPVAAAITAIDFDHEQFLGSTLADIAAEKAGVVKHGTLVALAPNSPVADAVVRERCEDVGATLIRVEDGVTIGVRLVQGQVHLALTTRHRRYDPMVVALRGRHQVDNALTSLRLLEELSAAGLFTLSDGAVRSAVEDVVWPARLELLHHGQGMVLIDGAHNPAGARALSSYVREAYGRRLPMVVGAMRDKQIDAVIAALAPSASAFLFTAARTDRAASVEELLDASYRAAPDVPARAGGDPRAAVDAAAILGQPVVVAGSLYLAGEVRAHLS